MNHRHAIVIGASSGIGFEVAKLLASSGCKVAGVARRAERMEGIENLVPYKHDVTNFDEIPALFAQIVAELGGLDLVVYASGVMPEVAIDEFDFEKDRRIFEVNVLGAMAWLDLAAERFKDVGKGSIVAIGSVAGDRGRAGRPAYNASKAAIATFMEALRNRFAGTEVAVVTIKPGPTRTDMNPHSDLKGVMTPEAVAAFILAKSDRSGEHYVKLSHRIIFSIIRMLPSSLVRKLPQ